MRLSFKEVMQLIGYHCMVMLMGFAKVLYGATVAGLIVLAIYGFRAIPSEDGYIAVLDFIAAIATLVVALCCMYSFGGRKKKKGRYCANA